MATPNLSSTFVSWDLTPEEFRAGAMLGDLQIKVLQNQMCQLAEEKISLPFLPENKSRHDELLGEIGRLRFLIELSADAYKHPKQ